MSTILVYEFVSAGGLAGLPDEAELLPLGVAMRDAMVADLLRLPVDRIARITVADSAAAPVADDPAGRLRHVRAGPRQSSLALLREQAARHDHVWVVAPETDGLLRQCPAWVGTARWRGSTADALAVTSSKERTLARLAAHGLRTPLDAWARHDARRWVVKPDVGAGAVDTVVLDDRAAAETLAARRSAAGEVVTLQPWVEGEAMSVSLLCGAPGPADVLSLNRQQLLIGTAGRVRFAGLQRVCTDPSDPRWPALQTLADTLVRALPGLRGFVGIDLVWHARHGPVPIEVNARVSCAYVGLSAALGRNLAGETLERCRGGAADALA